MHKPLTMHASITIDRVLDALERACNTVENPGFCVACGHEQDGCEPDARSYPCEECGAARVFGVEELLLEM